MIKDKPWLGSGLGTFPYNSIRYQAIFMSKGDNRSLYPHGIDAQAHNEYLQYWAELGIIGLLLFLWIIAVYYQQFFKYIKNEKKKQKELPALLLGLMGAVTAVLIDSLFGFPLHLPASFALFWITMGLAVVLQRNEDFVGSYINALSTGKDVRSIKESKTKSGTVKNQQFPLKYRYFSFILILMDIDISICGKYFCIRSFICRYMNNMHKKHRK